MNTFGHEIVQIVEKQWSKRPVLVIGDVMLDRYIWGEAKRISPEAPVPIVHAARQSVRPGGAANVAMNIVGLGGKAILLGFSGMDEDGNLLEELLREFGVESQLMHFPSHPTTVKLRILCGTQQMLRLDTEKTDSYSPEAYCTLTKKLHSLVPSAAAIVVSDYAKGALSEDICRETIRLARQQGIPVLVDPKHPDFARYRGATTLCPNLFELSRAMGLESQKLNVLLESAQGLVQQFDLDFLIATLSEKGIALLKEDCCFICPAVAREVFDITGAGDTVIATLALAIASGLDLQTGVQLANMAAGIVVRKVGTVPVTKDELLTELMPTIELRSQEKVLSLEQAKMRVNLWRAGRQRIVLANGCFDLLHIGHLKLLEEARSLGDRLIVAVNSDSSVRSLKGSLRPIMYDRQRAQILAALSVVDAVVIFEEKTPLRVIEEIRPDVIVKGSDYSENNVVGAMEVCAWGGRIQIVPMVQGASTTELIARANLSASITPLERGHSISE